MKPRSAYRTQRLRAIDVSLPPNVRAHDPPRGNLRGSKVFSFDSQYWVSKHIHTYIHTYIHANLYSAKIVENESEALSIVAHSSHRLRIHH